MERLGKYEVLGEIGQGGMGKIYRARDSVIGREVAIKVIQERSINDPAIRERLYREAQAAGRLSHENIMVIHDIGEHEGQPYIVMEYLRGTDLRKILDGDAPLTLDEKLQIAVQICEGLHYAHEHGIVHRDIKPDNIRILRGRRVKIMDFGIARLTDDLQTLTHTSIGTPRYMSPEQIKGAEVDHRSDIFSFGVLFYELLSGSNPFWGEHVTTVIYKILHEQPEPVHVAGSRMEGDLQQIVARCLEKTPGQRYRDFGEVLADLNASMVARDWSTRTVELPASIAESGTTAEVRRKDATHGRTASVKRRLSIPLLAGVGGTLVLLAALVVYWSVTRNDVSPPADPQVITSGRFPTQTDLEPVDPPDVEAGADRSVAEGPDAAQTAAPAQQLAVDEVGSTRSDAGSRATGRTESDAARPESNTGVNSPAGGTSLAAGDATRGSVTSPAAPVEAEADPARDETLAEASRREAEEAARVGSQIRSANEARELLTRTRAGLDPLHGDAPEYREAGVIEGRGETAFNAGQYVDAGRHFESATRLLRELSRRPTGPPPEALAEQAVRGLELRLKEGFEQADLAGLRTITPFFNSWSSYFDVAHSITARVSSDDLRVDGSSATVQMQIDLSYLDNKNRRQRTTLRQLWTLQRSEDNWTVADVRVQ